MLSQIDVVAGQQFAQIKTATLRRLSHTAVAMVPRAYRRPLMVNQATSDLLEPWGAGNPRPIRIICPNYISPIGPQPIQVARPCRVCAAMVGNAAGAAHTH